MKGFRPLLSPQPLSGVSTCLVFVSLCRHSRCAVAAYVVVFLAGVFFRNRVTAHVCLTPRWSPQPSRSAALFYFSPPLAAAAGRYTHWLISQTYPYLSCRLDHTPTESKDVRTIIATRAAPCGSQIDHIALRMWHILADAPSSARRLARAGGKGKGRRLPPPPHDKCCDY